MHTTNAARSHQLLSLEQTGTAGYDLQKFCTCCNCVISLLIEDSFLV